jgi:hypothetical protein
MAASELLTMMSLPRPRLHSPEAAVGKGVTAVSFLVSFLIGLPVEITTDRLFRPSLRELTAPVSLFARFDGRQLDSQVWCEDSFWVGHWRAGWVAAGAFCGESSGDGWAVETVGCMGRVRMGLGPGCGA